MSDHLSDPLFITGTILVFLAAVPANGIVWTYRHVPWKKSRLGRVMFIKAATVATVLNFSFLDALMVAFDVGRPLWWEVVRLLTFAGVTMALWAQWGEYKAILLEAEERENNPGDTDHTFS